MRTVRSTAAGQPQVFDIAAATLTRGGTGNLTATFTATKAHRLTTGDKIRLDGADRLPFNTKPTKFFVVTVTSATVFTYIMDEDPGGNANVATVVARKQLESKEYDHFSLIRNNRLQVEDRTPDASLYVADANAHAGNWVKITALEDAVIAALTSSTLSGFAAGMPIPKGTSIKGAFTSITLTSGKILLEE
jgi:hypothetical protein